VIPVPRPYQEAGIVALRTHVSEGRERVILVCPTGSGKTLIASAIIHSARTNYDAKVLFVVHRKELIDQTIKQLARWGVTEVGVIRADDDRTNRLMPVQVATIQSIGRRQPPPADIVFCDEAHLSAANSWRKLLEIYKDKIVIGLTATPARMDGKPLGDVFQALEIAATYAELIKDGFIVEPRCFGTPVAPKLDGIKTQHGDFVIDELADAMMEVDILGDTVAEYQKHAKGRRTVVFAVNVAHSMALKAKFEAAGVRVAHVDADTPETERDDVSRKLDAGELDVVTNVGVYCLDDKTEILTSDGWVGIDGMAPEHSVANWDQGKVTFEKFPELVHRSRNEDEKMVTLNGRVSVRVTETHRMLYRTKKNGRFLKVPARELINRKVAIPVSGIADPIRFMVPQRAFKKELSLAISARAWRLRNEEGLSSKEALAEAERRVFMSRTLKCKNPDELTVDECRFIGFWLGDGSRISPSGGGVGYTVTQSKAYPKIIEWFDGVICRCGFDATRREKDNHSQFFTEFQQVHWSFGRGTGGGSQKRKGLYCIEPYLNKDGTHLFMGLNREQFDGLVEGWWMADGDHGDGTHKQGHGWRVSSTNLDLLSSIQAVACVRGYSANIRKRGSPRMPHHRQMYALQLRKTEVRYLTVDKFDLESVYTPERVWCVKTRTKNIITRREGTVVVMGNTEGWDQPCAKCLILARPTKSVIRFMQMGGRVLRPWNENTPPTRSWQPEDGPSVVPIVIDQGGNIDRHGFPHEDRIWSLDTIAKRVREKRPTRCIKCLAYIKHYPCEACGYAPEVPAREIVEVQETHLEERVFVDPRKSFFDRKVEEARQKGYKPTWASVKYKEEFGEWPPYSWGLAAKEACSMDEGWKRRMVNAEANRARWKKREEDQIPKFDTDEDFADWARRES
jgi:superfamily II DNA or RNA helicase